MFNGNFAVAGRGGNVSADQFAAAFTAASLGAAGQLALFIIAPPHLSDRSRRSVTELGVSFNQWVPVEGCSGGGGGGSFMLPIAEAVSVTSVNALAPRTCRKDAGQQCGDALGQRAELFPRRLAAGFLGVGQRHHLAQYGIFGFAWRRRGRNLFLHGVGMMLRKAVLGLVFGLAASCAHAQTAPSPADVGISKGNPDTFKLKDSSNTWAPFGTVDPTTHVFTPVGGGGGGGGSIVGGTTPVTGVCPNGQFLYNNASVVGCATVAGGGSSSPVTLYPTHALLTAGVTTPTGGNTVEQQGFYAAGDGGQATYQWNTTTYAYCNGGTVGSPVTADGLTCILPSGQSPSTAGRYILQLSPTGIDVRQIGMVGDGVTDNSALNFDVNVINKSGSFSG